MVFSLIVVLTLSSFRLFASPQMPDYMIFNKDTIETYNLILEQYLQKQGEAESGKLFGLSFRSGASFNCWRGYQAVYTIDHDSLFLVDIILCGELRSSKIDKAASIQKMKTIFEDKFINNRVYINWFTGDLNFPLNNNLVRWDGVFYKIYEKETVISISDGKSVQVIEVENYVDDPKRINRRKKDSISNILYDELKKVKWKNIDECDCSEKYLVTIGGKGSVSKVVMLEYPTADSVNKYWDKKEYKYCIKTVRVALRKLRFDIIKDKGKPFSEEIYIQLWFDLKSGELQNWTF
jgi:hypothetical protein